MCAPARVTPPRSVCASGRWLSIPVRRAQRAGCHSLTAYWWAGEDDMSQRRPSGCATVLWAFAGVSALVALAEVYVPVTAPLAAILVVLIILGAVTRHQARTAPVQHRPAVRRIVHAPARTFYRTRCDHCGAPRRHGADACRYCGRSLVVG